MQYTSLPTLTHLPPLETMKKTLPVICLNGFLGAGKTTTLKHVLETVENERIGVICNDVAAVNIDATSIQCVTASDDQRTNQVQSVQLENGCLCCTASGDLIESFHTLLDTNAGDPFDRIIIESTGVAEPSKLLGVLQEAAKDTKLEEAGIFLSSMVTILDSPNFLEEYRSRESIAQRRDLAEPSPSEQGQSKAMIVDLLIDQVETADIVVLNKIDCMDDPETTRLLREIVTVLNPGCDIIEASFGRFGLLQRITPKQETACKTVAVDSPHADIHGHVAPNHSHSHSHGHGHGHGEDHVCDEHCHDVDSPKTMYNITSFVYHRDRVFVGQRLAKEVLSRMAAVQKSSVFPSVLRDAPSSVETPAENPAPNPFAAVIRSKGFLWLDKKQDSPFYWSGAGKSFSVVPQDSWGKQEPGQSLVFIGVDMDEEAIVALLDSALAN